ELTVRASTDFDPFYEARRAVTAREAKKTGEVLVLTVDGKGVPMHTADLRPATRKAAEKQAAAPGNTKRFSLGKPKPAEHARDRKRMATVAAVYTIEAFVRTPEEIIGELNHL